VALHHADVHLDQAKVLSGIDLEVRAGDCWVVHGPNGSGKSTLLRTIYGDHAVAAGGSIVRAGIVPGVALEKFKLRTAYVAPHLQTWHKPAMPVMEVVASGRYASIGLNDAITATDRKHAERALRRFGMFAIARPHAGGEAPGQVRARRRSSPRTVRRAAPAWVHAPSTREQACAGPGHRTSSASVRPRMANMPKRRNARSACLRSVAVMRR